jgi:predicted amidohydrolase
MKIGFFQFQPKFMEPEKNYQKILAALQKVEADIMVLPELAITGYNFENVDQLKQVAENPYESSGVQELIQLSRSKKMGIVIGFAEKSENGIYNSALFITEDGIRKIYRKVHLFFREKYIFKPGDTPFEPVEYKGARLGFMICFDWFFPEVTRLYALKGTDIICHPSNLVLNYCQNVMISRSIENMIFIVTANRIGTESATHGDLTFTGQSQIVAPRGDLLYRAARDEEEVYVEEIDIQKARNKNITELNNLFTDRRPEFYKSLETK